MGYVNKGYLNAKMEIAPGKTKVKARKEGRAVKTTKDERVNGWVEENDQS